jgi:hypothetical protein
VTTEQPVSFSPSASFNRDHFCGPHLSSVTVLLKAVAKRRAKVRVRMNRQASSRKTRFGPRRIQTAGRLAAASSNRRTDGGQFIDCNHSSSTLQSRCPLPLESGYE